MQNRATTANPPPPRSKRRPRVAVFGGDDRVTTSFQWPTTHDVRHYADAGRGKSTKQRLEQSIRSGGIEHVILLDRWRGHTSDTIVKTCKDYGIPYTPWDKGIGELIKALPKILPTAAVVPTESPPKKNTAWMEQEVPAAPGLEVVQALKKEPPATSTPTTPPQRRGRGFMWDVLEVDALVKAAEEAAGDRGMVAAMVGKPLVPGGAIRTSSSLFGMLERCENLTPAAVATRRTLQWLRSRTHAGDAPVVSENKSAPVFEILSTPSAPARLRSPQSNDERVLRALGFFPDGARWQDVAGMLKPKLEDRRVQAKLRRFTRRGKARRQGELYFPVTVLAAAPIASAWTTPTRGPATLESLAADLARLTALVEGLSRRLDERR